jgi:electron transfer flavoprotein alpha subunit
VKEIIVWAEQRSGRLAEVSREMITKAVELAENLEGTVSAICIGDDCTLLGNELISYGSDRVFLIEDNRLALYQSDVYAKILAGILSERKPDIVLVGGTSIGMDIASRVAAKLRTGLTAHCVDLYIETIDGKDQLIQVIPGWGGTMMVKIVCPEHRPQMATVRPGIVEKTQPDYSRKGKIIPVIPEFSDDDFGAKTLELVEEESKGGSLEDTDIIISGGFGLYSSGGFTLIEQLAHALHGEVAGTRPAFDHEWIAEDRLIGQSGKNVQPKLFVSVGASGAMHYTTGFMKSKIIVAIDKNPSAPIFDRADIGIVGDLNRIVPFIIEELKKQEIQD